MAMDEAFVDMGMGRAGTAVRVRGRIVGIGHVRHLATADAGGGTIERRGLSDDSGCVTQCTPPDWPDLGPVLRRK